jgi:hypothetical protein
MSKEFANGETPKKRSNKDNDKNNVTYTSLLLPNPIKLTKSLIRQLKNFKLVSLLSSRGKEYSLDPIDTRTNIYRKGFRSRSRETMKDFDEIVTNGFGVHGNQTDYTLRFTLTPEVVRNPFY